MVPHALIAASTYLPIYLEMILLMRYTGLREMDPVHVVSKPLAQKATTTIHEEQ